MPGERRVPSILSRIKTMATDALRWLRVFLRWFMEPRLLWWTFLVLLIAGTGVCMGRSEAGFRWIGLVLQLLGVGTVAWNIHGTRRLFDRPAIVTEAVQWLRRVPRFRASTTVLTATGHLGLSFGRARLDIWHNADPSAALEARLDAAEKNLSGMRDRLKELERETEHRLLQQTIALEAEKQARATEDKNIRDKLKTAQVEGLHISTMGIVWLIAGVIMSTVSSELAYLANVL